MRGSFSWDFVFSLFALALILLAYLNASVSLVEDFSDNVVFFKEYSKASVLGDELLLNPEKGLAKIGNGEVRDHSLKGVPIGGNYSGNCALRAGNYRGEIVFFRACPSEK